MFEKRIALKDFFIFDLFAWISWLSYFVFCFTFLHFNQWGWQGTPLDLLLGGLETVQTHYRIPILFILLYFPYYLVSRFWQKRTWKKFFIFIGCCTVFFFMAQYFSPCLRNAFEGKVAVFFCERHQQFRTSVLMCLALSPTTLLRDRFQIPGILFGTIMVAIVSKIF